MKKLRLPLIALAAVALLLLSVSALSAGTEGVMKVDSGRPVLFDRDYQVAGKTLPSGEYKVRHEMTGSGQHLARFVPASKRAEPVVVPVECEMEPSGAKIKVTRADSVDRDGVRVMRKLRVAGNNAAFVFE